MWRHVSSQLAEFINSGHSYLHLEDEHRVIREDVFECLFVVDKEMDLNSLLLIKVGFMQRSSSNRPSAVFLRLIVLVMNMFI